VIFGTPVIPGNRGVMALGASLVDLLCAQHPDARVAFHLVQKPWPPVTVQTRHGPVTVDVITCRMALRNPGNEHLLVVLLLSLLYRLLPFLRMRLRRISPWIDSLASATLVGDIRGGDSFSDLYGARRFILATLPILSALLIRGRIVHFPQTYGPFVGSFSRWVARATLRRSEAIIARDTVSREFAQALVGTSLRVQQSPDVAFCLQPQPQPEGLVIAPPLPPNRHTLVGININGLVLNKGYSGNKGFGLRFDYGKFLTTVVLELLKSEDVHILLVPHTYAKPGDNESDNHAATCFRASLPPAMQLRVHAVVSEHDQHGIKAVIGTTDFFIGARMHACIAALSQAVPTVGVAYSRKFHGVFATVGVGDCVAEATSVSMEQALATVARSYQDRENIRRKLQVSTVIAKNDLDRVFRAICHRHNAQPPR
jgi:colanic acid/amylovoran biosynthesis protein